ncbi:DNA-binding NarL/FixJ family response regulator [Saccharomonospora amisosensis]|uniref:DNA-binding NarL/FixJ family response regulator n=1 Tax=Saccharomonospora amisosensis TaxID=1128677 RepID=A0A7X5URN9_9PSEU|nr:response regulator transcription factor [Saccharomonospora amisosensis]NIJ12931.1 DNA-binding NarL/FixJ family response regulator [Saccharomonospora amisosensis]
MVAGGGSLPSPTVTRTVLRSLAEAPRPSLSADRLRELTEREKEVLKQVASGLSNQEIAKALFLSPATTRTYVSRRLSKLNARDRSQLVVIAYESGLVSPGGTGWATERLARQPRALG